jgi:hypothetical protein
MQGSLNIRLELKKNLVASILNLSPETLSRVLHQLVDDKLIRVSGSNIHIESPETLKLYQHGPALNFKPQPQNLTENKAVAQHFI